MSEIKELVRTLSGSHRIGMHEYPWMVQTVLTGGGMYYAIVEVGEEITSTIDFEKEEDAKDAGCRILSDWLDAVKKKVGG